MALADDEVAPVALVAATALASVRKTMPAATWSRCVVELETRFNGYVAVLQCCACTTGTVARVDVDVRACACNRRAISALPRVAKMGTEAALRALLRRMSGFALLVRHDLAPVLGPQLPHLVTSLAQAVALDVMHPTALQATHDVRVVSETSAAAASENSAVGAAGSDQGVPGAEESKGAEGSVGPRAADSDVAPAVADVSRSVADERRLQATAYYRHPLRHVTETATLQHLDRVFQVLAQYGDLLALVRACLNAIADSPTAQRAEACHVCNQLLLGAAKSATAAEGASRVATAARTVMAEYVSGDAWGLPTTPDDARSRRPCTLAESQRNAMLVAWVVEGRGNVAQVLGESFAPSLMDTLYPIMARLGDGHPVVRQVRAVVLTPGI